MKKTMSTFVTGLLLYGMIGVGVSNAQIATSVGAPTANLEVVLDGKLIDFVKKPVLIQNHLLVPSESLSKVLGATITYDNVSKTIKITKEHNTYILPIGSKAVTINGATVHLETPAALINQVPYLPIRFISENMGVEVEHNQETRTVALKTNDSPSFNVLFPNQNEILYTNQVKVSVAAFNHELTDFRQQMLPKDGQGHIHLWLDTDPSNPKLAYKMIDGEPAVFDNIEPGQHTLTVQLVGNNHQAISPEAKQVITFTTAATPSLIVNGPKEGEVIYGDKVTVSSELTGFKLSDFRKKGNVTAEEGHLHLWLDTDVTNPKLAYKQITGDPVTFENVEPGDHTLTVQLVGANHKPIIPVVKKVVHFKTAAKPPQKSTGKTTAKQTNSEKTYTVNIESFAFKPGSLTVEVGSTVTFKNLDDVDHTVTAKDGSFDSGNIGKGKTYSMIFKNEGEYNIYCKPHNFMVGTIIVK
ncbi:stalk domain-containing protein [Ammoniphilus resinae]|uniref:Plastocyanin/uncharacterized protein YegJ (DUF2314 family) n=1 Tax=Ammoniphilus resinae TaxID=861532 RepID=A0ABS4GNS8_9BACL|nr:stalk domain-containing protein [Ammoniphilus resinae]MBP1931940.1 plastocyanin/uncharacterized protein YegJ (DUF2314 family) [Ammoniphilus resinae]